VARTRQATGGVGLGFEAKLRAAADALRSNMGAAEYKHALLGPIFLKCISDAFEAKRAKLESQRAQGADLEHPNQYRAANIFWIPRDGCGPQIKAISPPPTIGKSVDDPTIAVRRGCPSLKGVLPKEHARPGPQEERQGTPSPAARCP
jgi:type I restriction enzyme M protein